jgi:serine/threonine-protein kinase PknK
VTDSNSADEWLPGLSDPVEIGRGGFGVVYRAVETDLNRTVAVKILSGALDDLARQRFDRERRAMGALSGHPNIVSIYRSGLTEDQRPYLVMEYLTGGSMAERLDSLGRLTWRDTVENGVRLCAALETAHRAGVLHRDVKPENVFLSALGAPKLGDFGIARLEGAPQTQSAVITASLAHAAPELIDGKAPSVQSDIYGLASTLMTLVCGQPPFVRDTDESIVPMLARIATEPLPDLRSHGVPDPVVAVFEHAMAKSPAERFTSVADFGRALQRAQKDTATLVTPLEVQGIDANDPHGQGAPVAPEVPHQLTTPVAPVPPVPTRPPHPGQPPAPAPAHLPGQPGVLSAPASPGQPPAPTAPPAPGRPPAASAPGPVAAPGSPSQPQGPPGHAAAPLPPGHPATAPAGTPSTLPGSRPSVPNPAPLLVLGGVVALVIVVGLLLVVFGGGGSSDGESAGRDGPPGPGVTAATASDPVPTSLAPGTIGPTGRVATEIPYALGDNERLDAFSVDCAAGVLEQCDELYFASPRGSLFEEFGATCGLRASFLGTTPCAERTDLVEG